MPEPHGHLFHVELDVDRPGDAFVAAMPVWTPGSYLVREFARHVEGVAARDAEGRPLAVSRLDKHRFRVDARGAARATLSYRVFAHELSVRTSHLDGTHGFFNGASVLLYVEGRERERHRLDVRPPPGWWVATALRPLASDPFAGAREGPWRFEAADYDELVDSPVEAGTHRLVRFEARGKPHAIAVWGSGAVDLERLARDTARIVEHFATLFGGLPYERYLFLVHLTGAGRGGLEHAASTTLLVKRTGFASKDAYEDTLALVAHEFFHVWNVKRLRPAALVPYDYAREGYTRLLWWFEGVTAYYDELTVLRVGLRDARSYLRHLGEELTWLERTPGAGKMSLAEASLTAWIKYYRQDENTPNSAISYYQKGELVALALDLALRRAGRSLDELVRALVERHAGRGLPEDGVDGALAELLGADAARRFLSAYVRGVEPLLPELERALDAVGLRVRRRRAQGLEDKGGTPGKPEGADRPRAGWLGATLGAGPKLTVASVREGGPAWRAGLYAEDELVAVDGFRAERGALWDRLQERPPGTRARLSVFRRDELVDVEVELGELPEDAVWVEPVEAPTEAQRRAFQDWSGAALPAAERAR